MFKRYRKAAALGLAGILCFGVPVALYAAGNWSTLPIVGQGSFACSNVSGVVLPSGQGSFGVVPGSTQGTGSGIVGQNCPPGPPGLTGEELIPADTGLAGGAPPQTVTIPSALVAHGMDRNRIIGGDFTINLWQRGTTPLSNATPTTATMTADRWWAISPSGTVDVLETTPSTTGADYLGNVGFLNGMEVRRHTGTTGALTCIGQTLDQKQALPLIGNNAVFSFYGYAPATYSASNQQVTVSVAYFTAADSAASQGTIQYAGGNGQTAALSAAAQSGGIAGYTANVQGVSVTGGSATSVASGVATINLTQTPTRYAVYAPIPALTSSGTQVTGVSVAICGTFTAATSVTTDWFEIFAAQLEAKPSIATANLPAGVVGPTGFERRNAQAEAQYQLAYSFVVNEVSSSSSVSHGIGVNSSTTDAQISVQFPAQMRIKPAAAYTAGFGAYGNTTIATNACTGLTTKSNTLSTGSVVVQCAVASGLLEGYPSTLIDDGGNGVMSFSAEP